MSRQGTFIPVPRLPKRPVPSVRAYVFVVAAVAIAMVAVADASRSAMAQGHLDAEYSATLAGIPIGRGNWVIDIGEDQYTATATGGTFGLLRAFSSGRGSATAQGTVSAGQPAPTGYAYSASNDKRIDDVRMAIVGGTVRELSVDPPVGPHPDRIPITDADRRNVLDPMTATLDAVGGIGDPVSPHACGRRAAVFDGRLRYDLRSEFKRIENVKTEGYQGPVVICAIYFTPIAGYVPERYAIKYLAALRDAEVWLAPISGTRVLVPYRFSLPTPVGTGVLQATKFVSVARPPRAAANVKTQ
jgi:hypothetical protein